jgi:F-type H+-transporting ATPase subunit epsilon
MAKKLRLLIITPQKPVLDKDVDFVALPAAQGELGVLPGHIPYITRLNFGELRYKTDGKEEIFAVMGGFAQIAHNVVNVFAEDAALEQEINAEEQKQKIAQAKASLTKKDSDIDLALAEMELKKAILLLKVKNSRR